MVCIILKFKASKYAALMLVVVLSVSLLLTGCSNSNVDSKTNGGNNTIDARIDNIYPELQLADHLYVIRESGMENEAIRIMVETLQGIVAQKKAEIFILYNSAFCEKWLDDLIENYGITCEFVDDSWNLIEKFKDRINGHGFVQYKSGNSSINVACTVAGVERYVAVADSLVLQANDHGLVMKMDVSDKNEIWAFRQYKDKLNNSLVFSQPYDNLSLRDYGVATKSLYFYDNNGDDIVEVYRWLKPNAPVLGWYRDEVTGVSISSSLGKITVASDHANNFTVFSALPRVELKQIETKKNTVDDKNVHYVTFILSDGDNVQWYVNGQPLDGRYYGYKKRGEFPFGWSISPSLIDLAPNIMKYCYDNATQNDHFVAAVSGIGYIYPVEYPKKELEEFAKLTNYYMKRAGLSYVQILDYGFNKKVIDAYAKQGQIKGGFYMFGDRYAGGKGSLYWSGNKPFVTFRESLWNDNLQMMAVRLNSYKRNPSVIEGYTAVNVHPWSHDLKDVYTIVKSLDPDVKVVTPDEFMELIRKNVKHEDVTELKDVTEFDYSGSKAVSYMWK